ncbi:hypothetical protein NGF19_26800 [Streptomyces sp. RY43-2]|uniref:Uncharacterized protein n=1 Tax=Streptomyces macrolidinus TaxID=2952607 RepID=A0ABT0ZLA5_9ACTN|nr:hypothetical protein [Streptomyces macrolidinus]MCN9244351.1 hypothetical protein [Streptomyces macrolidinus]
MRGSNGPDAAEELSARIEAAAAGTPYRTRRTEWGLELTVDIDVPQWQERLTRSRITQMHTYRVELRPEERVFTLTDVVRAVEYEAGLGGVRLGRTLSTGRSVYTTSYRTPVGGEQYTFSSAEGHRLIRGAAREAGWREERPTSVKIAAGAGIFGGLVALGVLVALAVVFWL